MFDNNTVEKMMELGIGLSVMRQIPGMMESVLPRDNKVVSSPPPLNVKDAVTYVAVDGRQAGPLTEDELKTLIVNNILLEDTLVWTPQLANWTVAKQVPSVNKLLLMSKTANTNAISSAVDNNSTLKNDVVAAVAQLGYSNASVRKVVDEVLAGNESITVSEAVKEVLKRL